MQRKWWKVKNCHVYWSEFIASIVLDFFLVVSGRIFIAAIKHKRINNLLFKANELSKLPTQTLKPYKTNYSHFFFLFEVDSKNNDWMKKKLQQKLCCLSCSVFLTLFPRPIIPKNTSENTNKEQSKFEILHHPSNVSHSVGISKCPQWILALVSLSRVVIFLLFVLFYSIQMFCSFGACYFSQYLVYWKPWKFTLNFIRKHCYTNRRWKSPIKHVPRK